MSHGCLVPGGVYLDGLTLDPVFNARGGSSLGQDLLAAEAVLAVHDAQHRQVDSAHHRHACGGSNQKHDHDLVPGSLQAAHKTTQPATT